MPAIQILKKKLKGIRSTQKLTKAMKTVAAVKFSKLSGMYNDFSASGRQCALLYQDYKKELISYFPPGDPDAPVCVVVMGANKGMCGSSSWRNPLSVPDLIPCSIMRGFPAPRWKNCTLPADSAVF